MSDGRIQVNLYLKVHEYDDELPSCVIKRGQNGHSIELSTFSYEINEKNIQIIRRQRKKGVFIRQTVGSIPLRDQTNEELEKMLKSYAKKYHESFDPDLFDIHYHNFD